MRHTHPRQVQFYRMLNGREPFTEWYATIQNRDDRNRIQKRLDQLENGNFNEETENMARVPNRAAC